MKLVKLNAEDNIAFAAEPLEPGETFSLGGTELACTKRVPPGGKIALCDIPQGEAVRRWRFPIGAAAELIHSGEAVTAQNLARMPETKLLFHGPDSFPEIQSGLSFTGFPRPDGRVGVRNEIWILPLSAETAELSHDLADLCDTVKFPNIDGVVSCSFPYFPDDTDESLRTFAALAHHPNAAGVLIPVSCGSEPLVRKFLKITEGMDNRRIRVFACRSTENETAQGMALIHELAAAGLEFYSREISASELVVGMLCSFPNAVCGLTANPLLGVLADKITSQGGSVVLSCPKLAGADSLLSHRCIDETVFLDARERISGGVCDPAFRDFATPDEEAVFYLEPGGRAPVSDVPSGRSPICRTGLNLLEQPGTDSLAVSALAACGAQVILAACGDDTPGCSLVPIVRIAASLDNALRCGGRFDFLAGSLTRDKTMPQVSQELWNYLLALTASQQKTKNEALRHRSLHLF